MKPVITALGICAAPGSRPVPSCCLTVPPRQQSSRGHFDAPRGHFDAPRGHFDAPRGCYSPCGAFRAALPASSPRIAPNPIFQVVSQVSNRLRASSLSDPQMVSPMHTARETSDSASTERKTVVKTWDSLRLRSCLKSMSSPFRSTGGTVPPKAGQSRFAGGWQPTGTHPAVSSRAFAPRRAPCAL